tara:strand:+ start:144 stop:416 length:273 start_codon:yes stop_codon:yes gene_type:complete
MVTQINCYDNISNIDFCESDIYYVCSQNCAFTMFLLVVGLVWCCILGFFIKRRQQYINRNINNDIESQYEEDDELIVEGKQIISPPKYQN